MLKCLRHLKNNKNVHEECVLQYQNLCIFYTHKETLWKSWKCLKIIRIIMKWFKKMFHEKVL